VRWRIVDLNRWVAEHWVVSYGENEMLRLVWSLDLPQCKTRPCHSQANEKTLQTFKKGALLRA
jgi:hypothetical protein